MSMMTLKGFFIDQLKDLYSAEKQMLKALPKMEKAATEESLKKAFASHREETTQHVERLAKALEAMGEKPRAKHCEAMAGLLKEGDEALEGRANDLVRDVALIAAARRVEHYEMAAYEVAIELAAKLAPANVLGYLEATLHEEKAADKKLSGIAKGGWFTAGLNDEAREYDKDYRDASADGGSKQPLEHWTKDELEARAKQLDIKGRSSMNKDELVSAIRANS